MSIQLPGYSMSSLCLVKAHLANQQAFLFYEHVTVHLTSFGKKIFRLAFAHIRTWII